jgi:hypothetical protein
LLLIWHEVPHPRAGTAPAGRAILLTPDVVRVPYAVVELVTGFSFLVCGSSSRT